MRGVVGADTETRLDRGRAPRCAPGQIVRLHARDARSADRDLREALACGARRSAASRPAGALLFTCNGRGRAHVRRGRPRRATLARELGGAPTAGFFAAGEIGPVGGESFLHGFTASVAVFADPDRG